MRQGSITNIVNGRPVSSRRSPEKNQIDEDLRNPDVKKLEREDFDYLRMTMKGENMAEELLNLSFVNKAESVIEEQEQFMAAHMAAIKQHSKLIERESMMVKKVQSMKEEDDIEDYVEGLELILKRRRDLDDLLLGKLAVFKSKLKEEEEEHFRVT